MAAAPAVATAAAGAAAAAATAPEVADTAVETREVICIHTRHPLHVTTTANRTTFARLIGVTSHRSSCPISLSRGKETTETAGGTTAMSTAKSTVTSIVKSDAKSTAMGTAARLKRAATPVTTRATREIRRWRTSSAATRSVGSRTGRSALEVAAPGGRICSYPYTACTCVCCSYACVVVTRVASV